MKLEILFGGKTAAQCLLYFAVEKEGTSSRIGTHTGLAKAQVFIQLRKLEEARVLKTRIEKNMKIYSLNETSSLYPSLLQFLTACSKQNQAA